MGRLSPYTNKSRFTKKAWVTSQAFFGADTERRAKQYRLLAYKNHAYKCWRARAAGDLAKLAALQIPFRPVFMNH